MTSVCAVIRPRRSSQAGSGLSICRRMASTISQSNGTSPSGRSGAARSRGRSAATSSRISRRTRWMIPGQQVADQPAHRVPDQIHPVKPDGVKEAEHVRLHELHRVVAGAVAAPVAA